ncbi:hypothetical protein ACUU9X_28200 [Bacillus cereus]|uniref:hypothetical protein n=1 Tax=Bacillus cereus TaxID=1396 RepID=UPI004054A030
MKNKGIGVGSITPVQADIIKKLKALGFNSAQVVSNSQNNNQTYETNITKNKEKILVLR